MRCTSKPTDGLSSTSARNSTKFSKRVESVTQPATSPSWTAAGKEHGTKQYVPDCLGGPEAPPEQYRPGPSIQRGPGSPWRPRDRPPHRHVRPGPAQLEPGVMATACPLGTASRRRGAAS